MNNSPTITVQTRIQAQVLHSIAACSNLLRDATRNAAREMERRTTAISEGQGIVFGLSDSSREVFSQGVRLQAFLETAGYVGLNDHDVRIAMSEDYVKIEFTEKD